MVKSEDLRAAVVVVAVFCGVVWGESFVMPEAGWLYMRAAGGSAEAVSEIGIGVSPETHVGLISGLPDDPDPFGEVLVGRYEAGETVVFSIRSEFRGGTYWAFSNDTVSVASRYAFMDLNNSLGMRGNVIRLLGQYDWQMYLDDAASGSVNDDDDWDCPVYLRLEPIPEPGMVVLLGVGAVLLRRRGA